MTRIFNFTPSQVAVLDIDICGPSIPKLMGCEGEQVHQSGSGWSPVVSWLIKAGNPCIDLKADLAWYEYVVTSAFMNGQFVEENLGVMSVGFLLSSPNDAVIWRGPKKNGIVF